MPPMPSTRPGTGRGGAGAGSSGSAGGMRGAMSRGDYGKQAAAHLTSSPRHSCSSYRRPGVGDDWPHSSTITLLGHRDFLGVPPFMGQWTDWCPVLSLTPAY